jgi:hypothetical protein
MNTTAGKGARRGPQRKSAAEKISALEQQIAELRARQAARERQRDPVLREIPKIQRRLRKLAQLAMNHQRPDIANSVTAFAAGLERMMAADSLPARQRERA